MRRILCFVIASAMSGGGCSSEETAPNSSPPDAATAPPETPSLDGGGVTNNNDASSDGAPPTKIVGGVIALNTNLSRSEALNGYNAEYAATYALGARGAQTAAPWMNLEPSSTNPGCTAPAFASTMVANPYFGLDVLRTGGFTDILLNVTIVSITERTMPCDLATKAFDDPLVKSRLHAMLDKLAPFLNDSVKYVSLGNEVDSYFKIPAHASEWPAYKSLIDDARTYLLTLKPKLKIGVTTTFEAALTTFPTQVASLNATMDVVILTYYPLDFTTFVPRPPSVVSADMASMVALAGGKPLVMQEWGYPTSAKLSSNEAMQADFITNTFSSWASHGHEKIPFISFFKQRDWNQAHCDALCPISPAPPQCTPFIAYNCSLGLVNHDGSPKAAHATLIGEVAARGIGK